MGRRLFDIWSTLENGSLWLIEVGLEKERVLLLELLDPLLLILLCIDTPLPFPQRSIARTLSHLLIDH